MREGQRVMLRPRNEAEANAGWEQPEGVVILSGMVWVSVLWDEEWGGKVEEIQIAHLIPIDEPSIFLRRQAE